MSDIRFNRWLHQSGTGGVYQDSSGRVGIGTSVPTSALDVQSGSIKIGSNTLSSSGVSTFTTVNATTVNATSLVGVTTAGITTAYINNLGIGTATVSQPLYVVGNAKVTATLSSNNLAFHAEATSGTSLSAGAQTKLSVTSESFDVANCYDATNSRYTPNIAGWYFIRGNCRADITSNAVLHTYLKKNGSTDFGIGTFINVSNPQQASVVTGIGFFNGTTDYVEIHAYSASAGTTLSGANVTFSGFLLSPTAF